MVQLTIGYDDAGKAIRRTKYAKSKTEAIQKLDALKLQFVSGMLGNQSDEKLADFLKRWLEQHSEYIRQNTYSNYERMIRLHINPCLGRILVKDLTPRDLQRLYKQMSEKGLSMRMREMAHRTLHVALETAIHEDRIIAINPCDMLRDKPRKNYNTKDKAVLKKEEIPAVLDYVKGTCYYIPFLLAFSTGMRRGEIAGLQWQHVDFDASKIMVRQQIVVDKSRRQGLGKLKTSNSVRDIPVPPNVLEILVSHKGEPEEFVCKNHKGTHLSLDRLSKAWAQTRDNLGLPSGLTFHSIRANFSDWLAEANLDIKVMAEIMGHDPATCLTHYRSTTPKLVTQVRQTIENFLPSQESGCSTVAVNGQNSN